MNKLDKAYTDLLQDILDNGITKSDRTGTGTLSVFGRQIRHNMADGFPLLTTKKTHFKSIVTELLWFLRGDTNIKYLVQNSCNIWNGDAYKGYEKQCVIHNVEPLTKERFIDAIKNSDSNEPHFIPDFTGYKLGDLGPIYGKQWRKWGTGWFKIDKDNIKYEVKVIDQIQNLINELKTNPDSRRLMVSAWNVGELDQMILPPCHYGFQVYTRELDWKERVEIARKKLSKEKFDEYGYISPFTTPMITGWLNQYNIPKKAISLLWNQRSVDTFLGLPFNIASYGLLLEIIAREVNMVPDQLIGNLGDVHLYNNHIEQAKEQITRDSFQLPTLKISEHVKRAEGDCLPMFKLNDFTLENYQSHPSIKAPLSN